MKKLLVLACVLGLGAFFVACSGKTELQFTNGASAGPINDILWSADGTTWTKTSGYAIDSDTESKTVSDSSTSGTVTCKVDKGTGDFVNATVLFPDGNSSLSIKSGSANKYTLQAN